MPRKSKPANPDERRQQFNINANFETREKLRVSADQAGRSIAKEVEFRLENSFARDEVIQLLLGGSENGRLLERLSVILRNAGDWRSDAQSVKSVIDLVVKEMAENAQPTKAD